MSTLALACMLSLTFMVPPLPTNGARPKTSLTREQAAAFRWGAIPGNYLYNLWHGTVANSPMREIREDRRVVRNLEMLHQPKWTEEVQVLNFVGAATLPIFAGGTSIFFLFQAARGKGFKAQACRFGRVMSLTSVFYVLPSRVFDFVTGNPIINARDASMAKYILVSTSVDEEPLLAIVGKAHVTGLVDLLTRKYGFTLETIDASLLPVDSVKAKPLLHKL